MNDEEIKRKISEKVSFLAQKIADKEHNLEKKVQEQSLLEKEIKELQQKNNQLVYESAEREKNVIHKYLDEIKRLERIRIEILPRKIEEIPKEIIEQEIIIEKEIYLQAKEDEAIKHELSDIESLKKQFSDIKNEVIEKEKRRYTLTEEIEKSESNRSEKEKEKHNLVFQKNKIKEEIYKLQADKTEIEKEIQFLTDTFEYQKKIIEKTIQEIDSLKKEIEKISIEKPDDIVGRVYQLESLRKELREKVDILQSERIKIDNEKLKSEEEIAAMKRLTNLNNEISSLANIISRLEQEIVKFKITATEMSQRKELTENELISQEKDINKLQEEIKNLIEQRNSLSNLLPQYVNEMNKIESEIRSMENNCKLRKIEFEKLEALRKKREEEKKEIEKQLIAQENENAIKKNKLREVELKYLDINESIKQTKMEKDTLEFEKIALGASLIHSNFDTRLITHKMDLTKKIEIKKQLENEIKEEM